jgi:hypothetical protein
MTACKNHHYIWHCKLYLLISVNRYRSVFVIDRILQVLSCSQRCY